MSQFYAGGEMTSYRAALRRCGVKMQYWKMMDFQMLNFRKLETRARSLEDQGRETLAKSQTRNSL